MHCLSGVRSQGEQWSRLHTVPLTAPSVARQIPSLRLVYKLLSHFHKPPHHSKLQGAVLFASSADEPVLTTTPQGTSLATAEPPTSFERLASALMFILPLSEGAHRMMLSFVQYCKRGALGFMYCCHYQHRQLSLALAAKRAVDCSREDIVTLQTLMQMSERLYQWFANWWMQLEELTRPLQSIRETTFGTGWLSMAVGTPEALWQLGCVFYMSVIAGLAALKIRRLLDQKGQNDWLIFFRKPQIVTVSYFCALLIRMSWAPMEGMSERSFHLYSVGATLLTVLTTWVAAKQIHALLFSRIPKIAEFLENMAQEVTRIAQLHRSFLLLDWATCLFSNISLEGKAMRSFLLFVYWKTVTALEGTIQAVRQTNIK